MKDNQVNSSHLTFVCPMKQSDLQQANGEYFCDLCQKQIFDLTNCTLEETAAIQRREGPELICGIVRAVGVASLLSLSSCGSKNTDLPPSAIGTVLAPIPSSYFDEESNSASESDEARKADSSE